MKRKIFLNHSLDNLKKSILNEKKEQFNRLYEQCKLYKEQRLTQEHPPTSSTFMGMATVNLSLMYILTNQKHYLNEAKRWLMTGIGYEKWGHAHLVNVDLSASWLLFGYSLAYDWLKNDLTEEEKKIVKEKLILQGTIMYDYAIKTNGSGWSTHYWQNHNWINYTGLAAAGYALEEENIEFKKWTEYSKENFKTVFSMMPEDGSDYEGVVYWRYGVIWLYVYAHLLKERENINIFETNEFLKNTFFYRLYQSTGKLDEIINFGDCHDRRSGHCAALYYKVASEYNNEYAQKLGNHVTKNLLFREQYESGIKPGILPEAWLEFLWYDSNIKEKDFSDLPLVKYWEDLGLVVIKDGWDENSINFSFKCGHPGGKKQWRESFKIDKEKNYSTRGLSHQHPDNNSFILHGKGAFLAIDDGYNRHVKACEHNVVLVDGKGYIDEGVNDVWKNISQDDVGEIKQFINENGIIYIQGETGKSYAKELELKEFTRHIINTGDTYFYMIDKLDSSKEHTYTWTMHADNYPEIEKNKLVIENGPATLEIFTCLPENKKIDLSNTYVKAVMTTQEPDKYRETNMKTISISNLEKSKELIFMNILNVKNSFTDKEIELASKVENGKYIVELQKDDIKEKLEIDFENKMLIVNRNGIEHIIKIN